MNFLYQPAYRRSEKIKRTGQYGVANVCHLQGQGTKTFLKEKKKKETRDRKTNNEFCTLT